MQCHSTAWLPGVTVLNKTTGLTRTQHWPGHVLIGRSWSKATSCESKTVSCAPHPPTFSHLTIDKSRRQVHTVVDRARYEGSYCTTKTSHIDSPHPKSHLCTRTHTHKRTQHWLGHMPTGHPWSKATWVKRGTNPCHPLDLQPSRQSPWESVPNGNSPYTTGLCQRNAIHELHNFISHRGSTNWKWFLHKQQTVLYS